VSPSDYLVLSAVSSIYHDAPLDVVVIANGAPMLEILADERESRPGSGDHANCMIA
jgi:hypothetical protein